LPHLPRHLHHKKLSCFSVAGGLREVSLECSALHCVHLRRLPVDVLAAAAQHLLTCAAYVAVAVHWLHEDKAADPEAGASLASGGGAGAALPRAPG